MLSYSVVFVKKKASTTDVFLGNYEFFKTAEASHPKCPVKKSCNFIKKRLQYRCFSVKIVKLVRIPIWRTFVNDCFLNSYIVKNTRWAAAFDSFIKFKKFINKLQTIKLLSIQCYIIHSIKTYELVFCKQKIDSY